MNKSILDDNEKPFDCSRNRLCDLTDLRFIEICIEENTSSLPFSITRVEQLNKQLLLNSKKLNDRIKNNKIVMPENVNHFKEILIDFHKSIFEKTPIKSAGIFRKEQVFVDIDQHQIEGVPFQKIEDELNQLWSNVIYNNINNPKLYNNLYEATLLTSNFLSQFFRIHPFKDGNGRVGRAFAKFIMQLCGFDLNFTSSLMSEKKMTKKYIKALRFSHKCYIQNLMEYGPSYRYSHNLIFTKSMNHLLRKLLEKLSKKSEMIVIEEEIPND